MHTELRSPANISQIQDPTKTDIFGVRVQTFAILIYLRRKFLEDYIIFFPSFATATTFLRLVVVSVSYNNFLKTSFGS